MNETRISKPVKWTLSETYSMNDRLFQRLQSRLNAAERAFRRYLADLQSLQAVREPTSDPSRRPSGSDPWLTTLTIQSRTPNWVCSAAPPRNRCR